MASATLGELITSRSPHGKPFDRCRAKLLLEMVTEIVEEM
jgi:hypothetical protein